MSNSKVVAMRKRPRAKELTWAQNILETYSTPDRRLKWLLDTAARLSPETQHEVETQKFFAQQIGFGLGLANCNHEMPEELRKALGTEHRTFHAFVFQNGQ